MNFNFLDLRGEPDSGEAVPQERATRLAGHDETWTAHCRALAEELGLPDLGERVDVEWNPRMRSAAGRAFWPDGLIQLNPRLALISPSEIKRTVLHELAHLVAYERHPSRAIKSHGREWQQACADVGIPGEKATHHLELPSRKIRRRWRYECRACGQGFDRVRRFKRAVACYECCLTVNGGSYDESFRLIESRLDP